MKEKDQDRRNRSALIFVSRELIKFRFPVPEDGVIGKTACL